MVDQSFIVQRDAIIAAWHNVELTRRQIALDHGVSELCVQTYWQWAREQKILPRRHRTLAPSVIIGAADVIRLSEPEGETFTGFETVEPDEAYVIPSPDPLLIALNREHSKDPRRALDDVERHYKLSDNPSPAVLYALRRIHDVRIRKISEAMQ